MTLIVPIHFDRINTTLFPFKVMSQNYKGSNVHIMLVSLIF